MKRFFSLILLMAVAAVLHAQLPVKVETFRLDNGLKVILCEEHSQPKVYGCVVVHAGSKNENPSATGVAHYFEHIMFKGTDRIGTTDWAAEKPYLDSISQAYDRLHATQDPKQRHDIQLEINRLNIAASKYAIPNEVDAILQQMGCTGLNAGTSYDYTVYYNTLPSNQLSNWMDVYAERFRNPVFRLFQSELEAIYEEKNMYDNQMVHDFGRNLFTESFGDHPYSREVIGLADHLKNPQPSQMQWFFDTYYVANNMTLILVGDFNAAEARQLVKMKFSDWRSGTLPPQPAHSLPQFAGRKVVDVRQTPIKMGLMVFPGVPCGHPDYLPLQMLASLLDGGSGLLDKATTDGRIMGAQFLPLSLQDAGTNVIMYVPNIIGQKHQAAEQVIWDCLDSIKQGNFSEELLESIKISSLVERQRQVESYESLAQLLLQLELENSSYAEWINDNKRWMGLTRDEISEVAKRYFDPDRCTLVRSKMGFPRHDGAVKPDWEHLEAQNQNLHSPFAQMIASQQPDPIKPQEVDFKTDVAITPLTPNCMLYSAPNPKNDVFQLTLTFKYGELDNHDLERAMYYMHSVGADGMDRQQFNMALDRLGGSCYLGCSDDESTLTISGLEQNLDSILSLVARWIARPTHDPRQIKLLVDAIKAEEKASKNASDSWFSALSEYVDYGSQSSFLRKTPYKEWGKRTGQQLHDEVARIFSRNGHATFSGNTDPGDLCQKIHAYGLVRNEVEVVPNRAFKKQPHTQSQVLFVSNKKFLQSDIAFLMPSIDFDTADRAAALLFNEYFGGGMNSVVFQEIREFRSLGYSTYGRFRFDLFNRNPAFMYAFLGTQCDKTCDGVEAMRDLLLALPDRPDKLTPAIEHQVVARNSNYSTFRTLPSFVQTCMEDYGWQRDRTNEITQQISRLTMDDLKAFHAKYIKGRPLLVLISGNAKKFNPKEVASLLGPTVSATEYKYKQLFRF